MVSNGLIITILSKGKGYKLETCMRDPPWLPLVLIIELHHLCMIVVNFTSCLMVLWHCGIFVTSFPPNWPNCAIPNHHHMENSVMSSEFWALWSWIWPPFGWTHTTDTAVRPCIHNPHASQSHHQTWRSTEHLFVAVVEDGAVNLAPLQVLQIGWKGRRLRQGLSWDTGGGRACCHKVGCCEQEQKHISLHFTSISMGFCLLTQTWDFRLVRPLTHSAELFVIWCNLLTAAAQTQPIQLSYETAQSSAQEQSDFGLNCETAV